VAGGIHTCHEPSFWCIFDMLGAFSRSQQIRPFDQRADGILAGEGCGFVILRKLSDAIKDEQKIYAVIKGVGVSSDGIGTSLMRPAAKGQIRAIQSAWQEANLDYNTIGYLEAHGTATPVGDKTELESMGRVFGTRGNQRPVGFGSVKSMIGHAMPAAGMAGLIKTALALYHGKLPPTLHCEEPLADFLNTRFNPVQNLTDWDDLPRRAGVNAFGFGGINAHVVLDGYNVQIKSTTQRTITNGVNFDREEEVVLMARKSNDELIGALLKRDFVTGDGPFRIALFNPADDRIKKAIEIVQRRKPWRNGLDIWYTPEPLLFANYKTAFVFPGLDGLSTYEVKSITDHYHLKEPQYTNNSDLVKLAMRVTETSAILDFVLKQNGVRPDTVAGHSLGQWSAHLSAGMIDFDSVTKLHQILDEKQTEVSDTLFLNAGCSRESINEVLGQLEDVYLSNDNCPHQVVVCGSREGIDKCKILLGKKQIINHVLPFQSGFHTPFAEKYIDELRENTALLNYSKPKIPVWSATTASPYPDSIDSIKKLQVEHLLNPVRFRELTEKLYENGVRVFVQIGGGALTGFIDDTLKGKNILTISAISNKRSGLSQLWRLMAALFVEGKVVNMEGMPLAKSSQKTLIRKLQLGTPLAKQFKPLEYPLQGVANKVIANHSLSTPILKAFNESLSKMNHMQTEIAEALQKKLPGSTKIHGTYQKQATETARSFSDELNISLETHPYLIDHSMVRQRHGWHCVEDCVPVIPLTMTLELLAELAQKKMPGKKVHKVLNFKVHQWLNVSKPFHKTVKGEINDIDTVRLVIDNYAEADIVLKDKLDEPPLAYIKDIGNPVAMPITQEYIYKECMFHGPRYQGIERLDAMGDKGLRGVIVSKEGKGSLLDNAGQMIGLWLSITLPYNHMSFPIKIDEVQFFGDMHVQQGQMECLCRLRELDEEFAVSDIELRQNGKTWALLKGWRNRRLEMEHHFWKVCVAPQENKLSQEVAPGIFVFKNAYRRVSSWQLVFNRFCNQYEKEKYETFSLKKRKSWLISRVALKDAVRTLIERTTGEKLFPAEFTSKSDSLGRPYVEGASVKDVKVSLAHKNDYAVAAARMNEAIGVDIEEIKERTNEFIETAFHMDELDLFPKDDLLRWLTRAWVAKEAYGKYKGIGLMGNPKKIKIEEINGPNLRIESNWIKTIEFQNYIIGWTE